MNRIYRLVWSVRLNALVAVSEHARGRGKRGGRARQVMGAVTGTVLAFGATPALANGVTCTPGTTTISTAVVDEPCMLDADEGVIITSSGSITSNAYSFPFSINNINISPGVVMTGNVTSTGGINNAGTIAVTGTMNLQANGIAIATGTLSGGIVNSGTITSDNGVGILVDWASTVSNGINNSGTIDANQYTISISNGSTVNGGITNSGTQTGANGAISIDGSSTVNGDISNTGTINSDGTVLSINQSTINGNIVNAENALFNSAKTGIAISNASVINGDIINHGTISVAGSSGSGNGILLDDSTLYGDIINTGTINLDLTTYDMAGIYVYQSTVEGSIDNSGTIEVTTSSEWIWGIALSSAHLTGGITNSGTISASATQYSSAYGIWLTSSQVEGSITNTGTITSYGIDTGYGIALDSNSSVASIVNSGSISAEGGSSAYGIMIDSSSVSGGIVNSGTISATSPGEVDGIAILNSSDDFPGVTGGINNTGTVSATSTDEDARGIRIANSGRLDTLTSTNSISATSTSGAAYGIQITDSSSVNSITNSGAVNATSTNEQARGIQIVNAGSVESITNSGTISATNTDLAGASGIYVDSEGTLNTITNSGTISGQTGNCCNDAHGIYINGASLTSITNAAGGTISGVNTNATGGYGLYLGIGAAVSEGLTNSGTMTGTYASVMDNSGTFGNPDSYGLQQILVQGNNTAAFNGDVAANGAHFIIDGGATYSSNNAVLVDQFTVEAGALFNMGVMEATGEFQDGVTVTNGFSNEGIVNIAAGTTGTITGDYSQSADATFRIGLTDATSNYGKLAVSGNATIADGSKIDVLINGSPSITNGAIVPGIITADILTVNPDTLIVTDNSFFLSFIASNERAANELDLVTTADPDALNNAVETYNNPAATGVAGALTDMLLTGVPPAMEPVFEALASMSPEEASAAMEQMLPAIVGAGPQAGLTALHSMNKIIQSRIESNQGLSSSADNPDDYMWVRAFGNWGDQDDQDDISGFSSETGGLVIGGDAPVNEKTRAGVAFTYAATNVESNSDNAPSEVDVDTYELVAYASYNIDPRTDINVQFDVGQNQAESKRHIPFASSVANADFDSLSFHGSAGIGRLFELSDTTNVTPSVRMDYTSMTTEDYTETGAGPLNLSVDEQDFEEFLLSADAKFAHSMNKTMKLVGNVTGGYDFINDQVQTTSIFTGGGPAFVTDGLDVSPWFYRAGFGLINDNQQGLELSVRYDMEGRSSGYLNQTLSGRIRWLF